MRIRTIIFLLLLFFACKKSNDGTNTKLLRTESTDNSGNTFYTRYGYDNSGRIITISQYENDAQPAVTVNINYSGNDVVLSSFPADDPAFNKTKEVHLTLDAAGRMMKRIEYTHGLAKTPPGQQSETFKYDTLVLEYDAAGFLNKSTGGRYDSIWVDPTYNSITRFSSVTNYSTGAGNLINSDEYVVYPVITRQGSVTTVSGGSSEYHHVFNYTRSFANKTDFKNAAILNEYRLYYEPYLNISYKNMTDQVITNNLDRDINGSVIYTGNSTINIERMFNSDGLLSSDNILTQNAPYREIHYFYGK